MIKVWNDTVAPDDTVYILGDFSFRSTQETATILEQLPGHKHLILGNHDKWYHTSMDKYFVEVSHYLKFRKDGHTAILFHYPIVEYENMHHGAFHLYGHVHGNYHHAGRAMDVGIDARPQQDMGLWNWNEIVNILVERPILLHHSKIKETR